MSQPEARLQRKMQDEIRRRGGFVFKVHGSAHMMAGLPDLVCCYRGFFIGLEAKMPGNKTSARQDLVHDMIRKAEGRVHTVYSVEEVRDALAAIDSLIGEIAIDD